MHADRSANLNERAYQQIRSEILFYQLPPGCRVSEGSLTARFNLRQAAVRTALLRLVQEGLVDRTDERSPRVAPLTLKDVRDIYGLRALVEPRAAELAAGFGVGAADIDRLRQISQSRYELGSHGELVEFLRANREFNMRVAAACGNERLVETIAHLQDLTLRILYVGIRSLNVSQWFQATHFQIVEALETRDGKGAAQLWTTDLHYGERLISEALIRLPELSQVNLAGASLAQHSAVP
ncbi:MAG TPA: GntR family transcriptional regulator, partial [Steroidobacteraceae bacterium]|nr:GntR family transcriptional regulator [Steroidobacteraceae bacterium]